MKIGHDFLRRVAFVLIIISIALILLSIYIATAQAEQITFKWDYDAATVENVKEFRFYSKLNDGEWDFKTPVAVIPMPLESIPADSLVTFTKQIDIALPANTRGSIFFIVRAADEFNESGDSNEAEYRFSTVELPVVVHFQIIVNIE